MDLHDLQGKHSPLNNLSGTIDELAKQIFFKPADLAGFHMAAIAPLSADDVREIVSENAELLAKLLEAADHSRCYSYQALAKATAITLVDHPIVFGRIVQRGLGVHDWVVALMSWAKIVEVGCAIIEATRDASPDGFLQAIVMKELRPHSTFLKRRVH